VNRNEQAINDSDDSDEDHSNRRYTDEAGAQCAPEAGVYSERTILIARRGKTARYKSFLKIKKLRRGLSPSAGLHNFLSFVK